MKKYFSIVLCLSLLLNCFSIASQAVTGCIVSGETVSTSVGQQIRVPVSIKNNLGMMGFKLIVEYDPDYLVPVSTEKGEIINTGFYDDSVETSVGNSFFVVWSGSSDMNADGVISYLNFEVKNVSGDTEIILSYSQEDTFNEYWEDVLLNCENITVSVDDIRYVRVSGSAECIPGQSLKTTLNIKNCSLDTYDFVIKSIDGLFEIENISCQYADVKFFVNEDDVKISLKNIPDNISSMDISLSVKLSDKFVEKRSFDIYCDNKECGNFEIDIKNTENVALINSIDVEGDIGSIVEIPVLIYGCKNLLGYKLIFNYDGAVITPIDVINSLAIGGNFGNNIGLHENTFSVVWNCSDALQYDSELLLLKVKIIEKKATKIDISYSAEDTFNENWDDVTLICNPIRINHSIVDVEQEHTHNYVGSVTKVVSCTSNGVKTYICTECGDFYEETIPAPGHAWTESTCTTAKTCTVCNVTDGKPLGHDWSDSSVCNRCGETNDDVTNNTRVMLSNVTGKSGETVKVYVSFDNATDVKTMSISDIVYDSSKLTFIDGEWLAKGAFISDWNQDNETGVIMFQGNTKLSGDVFVLTFEIQEKAEDAEVEIDCNVIVKVLDEKGAEKSIDVEVVPSSVNIVNVINGDVNGDGFVDSNDAIQLLYHTMLPDRYEINQDCDFDGNGYVDSNDAIHLLYHTMLPERYPLG